MQVGQHGRDGYDLELLPHIFHKSKMVKEWIKINQQRLVEIPFLSDHEEIRTNEFMEAECKNLIDQIIEKYSRKDKNEISGLHNRSCKSRVACS